MNWQSALCECVTWEMENQREKERKNRIQRVISVRGIPLKGLVTEAAGVVIVLASSCPYESPLEPGFEAHNRKNDTKSKRNSALSSLTLSDPAGSWNRERRKRQKSQTPRVHSQTA